MMDGERDIATWKEVVEELEDLLADTDGRAHGRLARHWLIDNRLRIIDAEDGRKGGGE